MHRCILAMFLLSAIFMQAQGPNYNPNKNEPPILGPHWVREKIHDLTTSTTSKNLTYHGGPVLHGVTAKAIFWGPSWATSAGDKISGLDKWYSHIGTVSGGAGSSYEATVDEYADNTGQQVSTAVTYGGHIVDSTRLPALSPSTVLGEVCKVVGSSAVRRGYYPVYVDRKRNGANYCAYHSWGSCSGTPLEFAFIFNLDGDSGCNPRSTVSGQSQGLAALANTSGHELSETRSDPNGNAWYAGNFSENADNCAWTFGGPYVTFLDGTHWKVQGNWSNKANNSTSPNGFGYSTSSGRGCVDGTNKPGPYTR